MLVGSYPDENFAREIMQLFTIGLYDLDDDATPSTGAESYDLFDIESFSRVWTGFEPREVRANVELTFKGARWSALLRCCLRDGQ